MSYFISLFSLETYNAFTKSTQSIAGFRHRQRRAATKVAPGDALVCYITKLSRWCGVLDVIDGPFIEDTPIFLSTEDPFVIRFRVKARVWLPWASSVPIQDDILWSNLSFTRQLRKGTTSWTGKVRTSLVRLLDADGAHLDAALSAQARSMASACSSVGKGSY